MFVFIFFFFQAEDGIRDLTVTGVQTCALPILSAPWTFVSGLTPHLPVNTESLRKTLFSLEYIMPPVAVLCQPGGYVVDCEVHGLGGLELLPAERHGHRGSRNTAR